MTRVLRRFAINPHVTPAAQVEQAINGTGYSVLNPTPSR